MPVFHKPSCFLTSVPAFLNAHPMEFCVLSSDQFYYLFHEVFANFQSGKQLPLSNHLGSVSLSYLSAYFRYQTTRVRDQTFLMSKKEIVIISDQGLLPVSSIQQIVHLFSPFQRSCQFSQVFLMECSQSPWDEFMKRNV